MKDACSIIKKELSSGAKTSKQLKEACKKAGIVESTFYYHLKQLVEKLGEVKKVAEENGKGGIIMKYVLAEEQEEKCVDRVLWGCTPGGISSLMVGDVEIEYPPNRMLLELAAWIRHKPANWNVEDDYVKKAKLCLEYCQYLVPKIGETHEDPELCFHLAR
jgi:predicted nucleic acid-binding protein